MPFRKNKPYQFHPRGQKHLKARSLNEMLRAVPSQIRGGDSIQVNQFGERIVIKSDDQDTKLHRDLRLFTVQAEFDDWLLCAPLNVDSGLNSYEGQLTTRTSDTAGTFTMEDTNHGISTGDTVIIRWDDGTGSADFRTGVTVGTVAGTSVPVSGGSGDNLPALNTENVLLIVQRTASQDNITHPPTHTTSVNSSYDQLMYVAKPFHLQRTPWDGKTINSVWNGRTSANVTYSGYGGTNDTSAYLKADVSTPSSDHSPGRRTANSLTELIEPQYAAGDIIIAKKAVTGYYNPKNVTSAGVPPDSSLPGIIWQDINEAGRSWKRPRLQVQELDGSPAVHDVDIIKLDQSNGLSLTDNTDGSVTAAVKYQMSVTADASGLKLVNDVASPGNLYHYATNSSGTKGWYLQAGGGGSVTTLTLGSSPAASLFFSNGNWYCIEVEATDFTAAATSEILTLVTLPTRCVIHMALIELTTVFDDTTSSHMTSGLNLSLSSSFAAGSDFWSTQDFLVGNADGASIGDTRLCGQNHTANFTLPAISAVGSDVVHSVSSTVPVYIKHASDVNVNTFDTGVALACLFISRI